MDNNFEAFVEQWQGVMILLGQITFVVGAVMAAIYLLGLASKKEATAKFKYISLNEIKYLWYVSLSWSFCVFFCINALIVRNHSGFSSFEFTVKSAVSIAVGFLVGYIMRTYLSTYYPFTLEKRLSEIRFKKRVSKTNGKLLKLLNEDQEDEYLSNEMIAEENLYKYDYDVWLDEESGEAHIEKYDGDLKLLICDNCRFRTFKLQSEILKREASSGSKGLVQRVFNCSHCGYIEDREVEIASLGGK